MKAKVIRKTPDLPQEIIDIIVHEIASQDSTRKALKLCSLVSKSFCSSCRPHLFSNIELVSNRFSQSRAAKLVQILQNPDNVGLAACVRSLTLIFDVPRSSRAFSSPGSRTLGRRLYKSKMMALDFSGRLDLYENDLTTALNLLMQAPLESFTLHARRGVPDREIETEEARRKKRAILMACIAPLPTLRTLRTLRLSNLDNIDESVIACVIRSSTLKELALRLVTLKVCDEDTNLDLQPITSQIEQLDLRHISFMKVLRTMGRPTFPALPMPYPFITFSRLRNLTISGPWPDLEADTLWQFMLGVADTLETLEIEEIKWEGPVQLGQLTSLRNLKIISSALGDANGTLEQKLISICQLLSTAAVSSPVEIQSFTIQFNVQVDPETDFRHAHSIPSWLDLDDILTGNPFANLRQVDLDFHFFIFSASTAPADWQPRIDIHILPRLSTHPFINFRLNIQKIYTPHPMAVQLYFL